MNFSEKFELLLLKADCHLEDDKYASAYRLYLKCLAIEPNNVKALNNVGFILCEVKADENALFFLRRAFRIDCTDDCTLINTSCSLIELKRFYEASKLLNKILDKDEVVYNNLGYCYYKMGLYHDAMQQYNLSIEKKDHNPDAYTNRGILKSECFNNIDSAIRDLEVGHQQGDVLARLKLMRLGKNHYHSLISN